MRRRTTERLLLLASIVVLLLIIVLFRASGSGDEVRAPDQTTASIPDFALATAVEATPEVTAAPGPTALPEPTFDGTPSNGRPITVSFVGDVHGESPIAEALAAGENPFAAYVARLSEADITVANLETTVGSAGTPDDKEFVFQAPPALATTLAESGVDVVSMANNHGMGLRPRGGPRDGPDRRSGRTRRDRLRRDGCGGLRPPDLRRRGSNGRGGRAHPGDAAHRVGGQRDWTGNGVRL